MLEYTEFVSQGFNVSMCTSDLQAQTGTYLDLALIMIGTFNNQKACGVIAFHGPPKAAGTGTSLAAGRSSQ